MSNVQTCDLFSEPETTEFRDEPRPHEVKILSTMFHSDVELVAAGFCLGVIASSLMLAIQLAHLHH